jgi:hypothetical protein
VGGQRALDGDLARDGLGRGEDGLILQVVRAGIAVRIYLRCVRVVSVVGGGKASGDVSPGPPAGFMPSPTLEKIELRDTSSPKPKRISTPSVPLKSRGPSWNA